MLTTFVLLLPPGFTITIPMPVINKPINAKIILSFKEAFNFPIRKLNIRNANPTIIKIIPILNL
jgi:hypothetical protein